MKLLITRRVVLATALLVAGMTGRASAQHTDFRIGDEQLPGIDLTVSFPGSPDTAIDFGFDFSRRFGDVRVLAFWRFVPIVLPPEGRIDEPEDDPWMPFDPVGCLAVARPAVVSRDADISFGLEWSRSDQPTEFWIALRR
jgi:hypothetical protein